MTIQPLIITILGIIIGAICKPLIDFTPNVFIIGGFVAEENQFPFMASLRIRNQHFCAGTILNNQWILTAAHCLQKITPKKLQVVVGTKFLASNGVYYNASKLFSHEYFMEATLFVLNDIGLIKTKEIIQFNSRVKSIELCKQFPTVNDKPIVIGWGIFKYNSSFLSNELRYLNTTIINSFRCITRTFPVLILSNEICAKSEIGKGACNGDSGGPLVLNNTQYGIVSWGIGCANGYPDIYSNPCEHLDWINNIIDTN